MSDDRRQDGATAIADQTRAKPIERLFVQFWPVLMAVVLIAVSVVAAVCGLSPRIDLGILSKVVDIVLKAFAMAVGAIWSINRYFVQRTDQPQLKIECSIDALPAKDGADTVLVSFRFELLNTSKVLLRCRGVNLRIDNVVLAEDDVYYETLLRWPKTALHPINAIEPNSWAAISEAFACPVDVETINLFLELHLVSGARWTWHRIQTLKPKAA